MKSEVEAQAGCGAERARGQTSLSSMSSSAGGQAGGMRSVLTVLSNQGRWLSGAGVLSSVFLLEQELESGRCTLYVTASSKCPHSSHCECFRGIMEMRLLRRTGRQLLKACARPLSFDFHLQNSQWPLSPLPHPSHMLHRQSQLLQQSLHSWPMASFSPLGRRTEFPLGTGAAGGGSLAWFRFSIWGHRTGGSMAHVLAPLFGSGLWSDPAPGSARGD